MKRITGLLAGLLLCGLTGSVLAADAESLLPNVGFEKADASGAWAEKWPKPNGASWEQEEGNHFLRLKVQEPGKAVMAYMAIPMTGEHKAFELSFRARYSDIKPGAQPWFDGRVMMNFKDSAGKIVKGAPGAPSFRGSSQGWVNKTVKLNVPEGAAMLELMFTLFQAQSGTLDFDDVKLVPIATPTTSPAK